jgi:hypothetical protein
MEEIQTAIERAEEQMKSFGDPMDMFGHTFADLPADLQGQKESLARELAGTDEEGTHG